MSLYSYIPDVVKRNTKTEELYSWGLFTVMTQQEKKDYIKKTWSISSGKRITEMLYRYWNLKRIEKNEKNQETSSQPDIVQAAKEVFGLW